MAIIPATAPGVATGPLSPDEKTPYPLGFPGSADELNVATYAEHSAAFAEPSVIGLDTVLPDIFLSAQNDAPP